MADARVSTAHAVDPQHARRVSFSRVLAVGEFRALWLAQIQSVAGDQLARVAMTVLVYDRTRSPLLTAVTYSATLLPWLIGGVALAGLADRLPRREVMIACDLARALLVIAMAGVSAAHAPDALILMIALLFLVTLLDSPFKSARSALLPDILAGESYVAGAAVSQMTFQIGMVAGFALGGVSVAALGSRATLLTDAATFGISAVLLRLFVHHRPAAGGARGQPTAHARPGALAGIRLVFGDRRLRTLTLYGWLATFYVVPMGLAAPYAGTLRRLPLPVETGLLFAAMPLGTALGAAVLGRIVAPSRRQSLLGPLAVGSCAVLVLCAARPGLAASLGIFMLAGTFASYQLVANAAFVAAVPADRRGQAFGLANGGMQVLQGLWLVGAGAIASAVTPAVSIAASGTAGAVVAAVLAIGWARRELVRA